MLILLLYVKVHAILDSQHNVYQCYVLKEEGSGNNEYHRLYQKCDIQNPYLIFSVSDCTDTKN